MKNRFLVSALLGLCLFSCTSPDEVLEDFQVHVNPTFFRYVQVVNVEDLVDPNAPLPSDLTAEISGPNADLVYSIDGTRNFQLNDGTLQLIIPSESEPQGAVAYEYTVTVSANGYRGNSTTFTVSEGLFNQAAVVKIANLNALPTGLSNAAGSGGMDAASNTLAAPLTVSGGTSDSTSSIELTIPDNVKFLDADGNEITAKNGSGTLNVNILSLSDTTRAGQAALPGGTGPVQVVEDIDGTIDSTLMEATSTFDVQIDLDGVTVDGFSGGKTAGTATALIQISDDMINPETNQPYQAGQTVGVVYYDFRRKRWRHLSTPNYQVQVYQNAPPNSTFKLFVLAKLQGSSVVKLWHRSNYRPRKQQYTLLSRLENGGVPVVSNGTLTSIFTLGNSSVFYHIPMSGTISNWSTIRGNPYRIFNGPTTSNFLGVNSNFPPRYAINTTTAFGGRFLTHVVNFTGSTVRLGYTLECEGAFISPPVGVQMFYREHTTRESTAPYKFLYQFHDPSVRAYSFTQLEDGKRYDFRAKLAQDVVDTLDVLVTNNKIYEVKLPKDLCNRIGF